MILREIVSANANIDYVNALIVGGGRGGMAMIEVLRQYEWLTIEGVVDVNIEAPGMELARTLNIPVYLDINEVIPSFKGNLIINVTGDNALTEHMISLGVSRNVEIVSGRTAKILFDLVYDQLRDKQQLESKAMQLDLFQAMLNISKQFELGTRDESLLGKAIEGSAQMIVANKAIALECIEQKGSIVGAIGLDNLPYNINSEIVDNVADIIRESKSNICIELTEPLIISGIKGLFQLAMPVFLDGRLCYLMLFQVELPLDCTTRSSLTALIAHLEVTLSAHLRNKSLLEMAYRDPLTGLYNRRYFDDRIKKEISRIQRNHATAMAVMFFDLDNFKQINDKMGHSFGDHMLKKFAAKLHGKFRSCDVLARYGGDEFVALLFGVQEDSIKTAARRFLSAVDECQDEDDDYKDLEPKVGLSIGVGVVSQGSCIEAEKVMQQADNALYKAKKNGGGQVVICK